VTILLVVLFVPLVVYGIGDAGLMDPDEPYYAVPALEMMRSGTWHVPVFRGEPWFDKPVLFYWMVLGGYRLFGVTELAARAGSALAGLATALSIFFLSRRGKGDVAGPAMGAIVLSTSLLHVVVSRAAITDMTFTCFLTIALLAFAAHFRTRSTVAALAGGAAVGFAILTKGPAGALLPATALGAYSIFARRPELARPRALAASLGGAVAIAGPWYAYMLVAHRDLLLRSFLAEGNFGRFLHPEHAAFPFYYAVVLLAGLLPWSGALPSALVEGSIGTVRRGEWRSGAPPDVPYLLCWIGAVLAVFSLSASKLPTYILPAWPPAAMLLASFWTGTADPASARAERRRSFALRLSVVLAVAATLGLAIAGRKPDYRDAAAPLVAAGLLLVAGTAIAIPAYRRKGLPGLVLSYAAAMVTAVLVLVTLAVPRLEPFQSTRELVRQLDADGVAGEVIGAFRVPDVSLELYLGRSVPRVKTDRALADEVSASPGGVWVLPTSRLETLRADPSWIVEAVRLGPRRSAVRLRPAEAP
jgi:4-amino-4-deoxy-L-arabinose transferase-like glycosyltransferase